MNPDVVDAIERLRAEQVLTEARAAPLMRAAKGELVSVELELRSLLYAGVLLLTSGVGLFLKENHERLGPTVIAALVGAAALACLGYAAKKLPAFTWDSAGEAMLGADYVLVLGVLLLGADLAYVETQFLLLGGTQWPYHLLLMAAIAFVLAYRFDSRSVLSLALTSFAAWRGVAVSFSIDGPSPVPAVRLNALGCAALFLAAGAVSLKTRRKAHFEPVYVTLGLLLLFGALLSGAFDWSGGGGWAWWELALMAAAAVVIVAAYRRRRTLDFSIAVLAAYFGVLRILLRAMRGAGGFLIIAISGLGVVALLVAAQRRMKEDR